ncbi:MAG: 50S ribosomal protein L25/general stress protein Ctc [Rhodobacteraceae bacterium]|jgi:large subunit ribosomal protein L25|nr:50S ribosomal protein L25/general stress protein Ctc [Paracoccaceae bacterium]MEC7194769.1 50S ribosomal protein L25/general stress protein Ctc [Pseudomonadota bacterium]|tara:strand:+ start:126 stop:782 length:657 start_codon:yes stop_codon:yes gene_type:complete
MGDNLSLSATLREGVGKGAARDARRNNLVPGIIYGGSEEPLSINVKFNELLKKLNAGRFMSTLINLTVEGKTIQVICRDIQKHIVKDLPTHLDFMRLSKTARIKLFIPVVFINQDICKGIKRGGVLTVVRPEVELLVNAMEIPSALEVDIKDFEVGDTITISNIDLPSGTETTIKGRDFVIANIQAPSGLKSSENEGTDNDDPTTEAGEEEKEEATSE